MDNTTTPSPNDRSYQIKKAVLISAVIGFAVIICILLVFLVKNHFVWDKQFESGLAKTPPAQELKSSDKALPQKTDIVDDAKAVTTGTDIVEADSSKAIATTSSAKKPEVDSLLEDNTNKQKSESEEEKLSDYYYQKYFSPKAQKSTPPEDLPPEEQFSIAKSSEFSDAQPDQAKDAPNQVTVKKISQKEKDNKSQAKTVKPAQPDKQPYNIVIKDPNYQAGGASKAQPVKDQPSIASPLNKSKIIEINKVEEKDGVYMETHYKGPATVKITHKVLVDEDE